MVVVVLAVEAAVAGELRRKRAETGCHVFIFFVRQKFKYFHAPIISKFCDISGPILWAPSLPPCWSGGEA